MVDAVDTTLAHIIRVRECAAFVTVMRVVSAIRLL